MGLEPFSPLFLQLPTPIPTGRPHKHPEQGLSDAGHGPRWVAINKSSVLGFKPAIWSELAPARGPGGSREFLKAGEGMGWP